MWIQRFFQGKKVVVDVLEGCSVNHFYSHAYIIAVEIYEESLPSQAIRDTRSVVRDARYKR